MGRSYPLAQDGEWIRPVKRNYRMRCCDCGLVHRINFRVKDGHVELQPFRDNRSTSACRRKRRKVKHGHG